MCNNRNNVQCVYDNTMRPHDWGEPVSLRLGKLWYLNYATLSATLYCSGWLACGTGMAAGWLLHAILQN
eukprot:COSAG01_NODE_75_length_28415_cov_72.253267_23_plen_69_part_00